MLVRMLDQGEERLEALRGIRLVIYGASPMPLDRLRQSVARLGPVFAQLYGQSESPMTITVLPQDEHVLDGGVLEARLASAGRPWTNVAVRVVDESGKDVPTGEPGEVIVQGPQNMDGYWHRPEETARTLVDGWVHTRDIGTFDEAGYLFLLDRKEDVIITGGLNVYPRQVEDVLYQNPSVHEATVVGVRDDHWGEKIVAVVSLRSERTITDAELIAFCRQRLSGYKTPKSVVFVDQMPKSPAGKISRKQVRQVISSRGTN
jgi:acyl-CoA synthetase (AMP-forming)/AMP-acid ligase II